MNVDADAVATELRPLTGDHVVIDSITCNDKRIDAVVTSDDAHARVVFAHDEAGLVTWLHAHLEPSRFEAVPGGRVVVVNGPSGARGRRGTSQPGRWVPPKQVMGSLGHS